MKTKSFYYFLLTIISLMIVIIIGDKIHDLAFIVLFLTIFFVGGGLTARQLLIETSKPAKPKVYIAGAIKGLPVSEVRTKFDNAAKKLSDNGCTAINPFAFIERHNIVLQASGTEPLSDYNPEHRKRIMRICINLLMDCDSIFLLHDWQNSEGANFEKQIADFFKIPVYA